jgi:hypothetical protein
VEKVGHPRVCHSPCAPPSLGVRNVQSQGVRPGHPPNLWLSPILRCAAAVGPAIPGGVAEALPAGRFWFYPWASLMLERLRRTAWLLLLAVGVVAGQAHWPSLGTPEPVLPVLRTAHTFTAIGEPAGGRVSQQGLLDPTRRKRLSCDPLSRRANTDRMAGWPETEGNSGSLFDG